MRKTPGGEFLATLDNGVIVEVLGETQELRSVTWVKIAAIKNGLRMEGWIMEEVEKGVVLPGLYPMNEETKKRYEAERKKK